jgi:hypothetical protein
MYQLNSDGWHLGHLVPPGVNAWVATGQSGRWIETVTEYSRKSPAHVKRFSTQSVLFR